MADTAVQNKIVIDFDSNIAVTCNVLKNHGLGTKYGGEHLAFYKITDTLPFYTGGSTAGMHFSDPVWDYSKFKITNVPDSKLKLDFRDVPPQFVDAAKYYAIREIIINKSKIQSIREKVLVKTKQLFIYADSQGCQSVIDISQKHIEGFLQKKAQEVTFTSQMKFKSTIRDFITFYSANFEKIDYVMPEKPDQADLAMMSAEREKNKIPDIPSEYFDRFINRMLELMQDKNETVFTRTMAAELVILSQTGLRVSESLSLKTDSLIEQTSDDGTEFMALRYPTTKNVSGLPTYRNWFTVSNQITTKAFETINDLHRVSRREQDTDILFADTGSALAGKTGIDSTKFSTACERFFIHIDSEKFRTIDLEGEEYQCLCRKQVQIGSEMHSLYYPSMHMFRVHMCTSLRRMGVPVAVVEYLLSHLSNEIADYYYRQDSIDEREQEDFTFSEAIFSEQQDPNVDLLGGDPENRVAIKDFIVNGNVRVKGTPDDLIASLEKDLIIRVKPFGFCITAPRHACGKDIKANKILCYNGSCGNDYHMYWNLAANWRQLQDRIMAVNLCVIKKHWTEAEQQIKFIVRLVNERILDEITSFDKLIGLYGMNELCLRHPVMETVCEDYDYLKNTVDTWKKMDLEKFIEIYGGA